MFAEHDFSFDIRLNILLKEKFVFYVQLNKITNYLPYLMFLLFAFFGFLAFLFDYAFIICILLSVRTPLNM